MALSLSSQLGQLQHQQKQYASLLYTQQVSAQTDLDTIYHLGCKGMNKLTQIDNKFCKFQQSLFNVQNKGISRQLQNKQQNQTLDQELRQCLLLMSQLWSFDGTHQAMEYLLRNYKIHEYLADEVIIYFIVYHNTKLYVRLLQNLVDQQRNSMWGFLYEPISKGQTISRDLLIRQIKLDYRILKKIIDYQCQLLQKDIQEEELVFNVQDFIYSEEEIQKIKLRQPNQLSFLYTILYDLKVQSSYFDQLRGSFGRLLTCCLENEQESGLAFAYLIFQLSLFDSSYVIITEGQILTTAQWVYSKFISNIKFLELVVLFYQFGLKTSVETSLALLDLDLSKFYNNGLLLVEIIRTLVDIEIPNNQLNQLVSYLKYQLNKNDNHFVDSLISIMNNQIIETVRPYLQDTQYKHLFPKSTQINLTFQNSDQVLKVLNSNEQLSVGTLTNIIEDSLTYFLKSKKIQFLNILAKCLQIAESQFPQTLMFSVEKLYNLINSFQEQINNELFKSFIIIFNYTHKKQQDSNKIESILLLCVHFDIEQINEICKIFKFIKKQNNKQELIQYINQKYQNLIQELLKENKSRQLLIYQQLKIQLSIALQIEDVLIKQLNQYQISDSYFNKTVQSLSPIQLLNLENQLSFEYLKSLQLDPNTFFNQGLNHLGSLKVLLHKSSRDPNFALKLFLIYDNLSVEQKELSLQILTELKSNYKQNIQFKKITIQNELLQQTVGQLIKNRKEANYIKTLGNIKDQNSLIDLQRIFLDNFNIIRVQQIKSIANQLSKTKFKITQDRIIYLISFIEKNFEEEMLESYFKILKYFQNQKFENEDIDFTFIKKKLFQLGKESWKIVNENLNDTSLFPGDLRTQMIIFLFSKSFPNKQIVIQEDLDFEMIVDLLETPNLEIISHLLELLKANINSISENTVKKCFNLNLNQPAQFIQISQFIYDYLENSESELLGDCQQLFKKYLSLQLDLNIQINYIGLASCVRLIAKHTQLKKSKKAFSAVIEPVTNFEQSQTLLIYRIIIEQFQAHNPEFFNSNIYAYFISKIMAITSNMQANQEILQNFSSFSQDQWWIIAYIQCTYYFPKEYVQLFQDQINRFSPSIKLQILTGLAESLFYRTHRHQATLKVKLNQKLTQLQTPNLEACIKKVGQSLRGNLKPIKVKLSLLRILEAVELLQGVIQNFLLQSDLNSKQSDQLKSLIVHISKFSNVFAHSKLKSLSERIRASLIHSLKIETLVPLIKNCISIQSVSNILVQNLNDILRLDLIKINKQQINLIRDLLEQIQEQISSPNASISTEILLLLNYLYNMQIIQKQLQSQGLQIFEVLSQNLNQMNESDQSLVLNLFSLISQKENHVFLNKLGFVLDSIINLLCLEFNVQINDQGQIRFQEEQQIRKISNKQILFNTSYTLIKSFKGLLSRKHLIQLTYFYLIEGDKQGFQFILENIEKRVHLDLYISNIMNQVVHLKAFVVSNCTENLTQLIQNCETELVSEQYLQLNKELLNLFDFSREQFIDSEVKNGILEADKLEYQINSVYLEIILKINDIQLKKLYSNLIAWSRKQQQNVGYNFQKYRRIQFFKLSTQLSDKLGKYFTKYYSYIWDAIVNELNTFHNIFYETPKLTKLQKRTNDECDMYYKLELLLNRHVLQSLSSLCQNDCEQFVDTEKFEKLCEPIAQTLDCPKVQQYESLDSYMEEWITPTMLALFQLINDDYKWKDLHQKILMVISRHSNKKNEVSSIIIIGIVKLIHRLIDQLDERYLVLMNDLIPFLHQLTFSNLNSEELEKRVKQLIVRLSQLSGEDVISALK